MSLPIRNPRTGVYDYHIEPATADDLERIADELRAAQPGWAALAPEARARALRQFAGAIERHREPLLDALSTDTGRNVIAEAEIDGMGKSFERWIGILEQYAPDAARPSTTFPDVELQQRPVPYPVVGAISPWNFPLVLSFIDATPALLAGCSVIIKPSEVTPRFAAPLRAAIAEVPELASVLRIIDGDGSTGAALVDVVDVVAFTGSVATGRKVGLAAAERFIPAFLELGGKDPAIVMAGADLERATTAILRASVNATGQACQSLERIYVEQSRHDEFVNLLTAKSKATPLSHPNPRSGIIGPLIFAQQAETIAAHLKDAQEKGAKLHCGGKVHELDGGYFIEPTVLSNVSHDMAVMRDETFGPVMPVMSFVDDDEAVALANDSDYGLSAAVFNDDEAAATKLAERLNAGGISINDAGLTAFVFEAEKSAFRCSGLGPSRMGVSGLTRFLRQKAFYVNRGNVLPIEAFGER